MAGREHKVPKLYSYEEHRAVITMTEQASNHLASVAKDMPNVEFSVEGGGCSGMNYELKFTDREPSGTDQVISFANDSMKLIIPFSSLVVLIHCVPLVLHL